MQEGRGRILRQQGQVDPIRVAVDVVPLLRSVDGLEVARGAEDEVAAVGAEDGVAGVVPAVGDGVLLLVGDAVDVDDVVSVIGHAGVGEPAAVG